MQVSRRSMLAMSAGLGAAASVARASTRALGNEIVIGVGGDYRDIADAIAAISDNGPDNPYVLHLLPGTFGAFQTKDFVDIIGAGVKSSIIETAGSNGGYILLGSNVTMANLGIRYSGTSAGGTIRGAIQKQPNVSATEVVLQNIELFVQNITGVTAPKYAIYFGGKVDLTAWNVRIATESGGLRLNVGQTRWHGCDIYLRGNKVGL